jgi:holin-like protein
MKYIKQFAIICMVSLLGEFLNYLVPLPVPASVWGMVLMFVLLATKVVDLSRVEETADYLLLILPLVFVPLGAQILVGYDAIKNDVLPLVFICIITTLLVFLATAFFVQLVRGRTKGKEEK